MENKVARFGTALQAEHIKKKGTGFYWMSIVFGIISPLLYFTVTIIQSSEAIVARLPYNHILNFTKDSMLPFANFFFPLMIIIVVSRITQIDHKNGGWQLMETQPVSKFSIFFSKFIVILFAILLVLLSFIIMCVGLAWLLTFVVTIPKEASLELPFVEILNLIGRLFVASLFIVALQYVISVLISSFIWTIIIGFFGLLLTAFLKPFNLVPVWYPYEILGNVATLSDGSDLGYWFTFTETISLLFTIILLYIGYNWYRFKQLKFAFAKPFQILSLTLVLGIFGGLIYWLLQPNQMENHNRTVISGEIESETPFKNAFILDLVVNDTIAFVPIQNGKFKFVINKKLDADFYYLLYDEKFRTQLFFGSNDSIHMNSKISNSKSDVKVSGTRLAENKLQKNQANSWSNAEYYLAENLNLDNPKLISDELHDDWKEANATPNTFRTVDNYMPKNDYVNRSKKLVSTKYLNLWNDLVQKRLALYPNEKTAENKNIKEIKSTLSLYEEDLLSDETYFNYVKSQLILNNKADVDENTKALRAISTLKKNTFSDKMLFWQMKKSLEEASNTAERNQLIANYYPKFQDLKYQKRVTSLNKMLESLSKGKTAPLFEASTLDGKKFTLESLKGKYVVIDVWATWCGPCKTQSPYFEKMALKYKRENIQFLALSTDENKKKWFIEAKTKSKSIPQLLLENKDKFTTDYNIESIPRFILIDPNGNFVNSRMPFPSESSFEIILRKALNLADEM
jgi:thiol-disulfide isomerase/thioredoxin